MERTMQHPTSQDLARAELDRRFQARLRQMDEDQLEAIANQSADPVPCDGDDANRLLGQALCTLLADAFDASARGLELARGLLAKRRDDGRRATLARAIGEQARRVSAVRASRAALWEKAMRWKDHPCFTISAPLADFLPHAFEAVDGTLDMAQLRVHAACSDCSETALSVLGITVTDAAGDAPAPDRAPETEEEIAALMAEMLA
jgi:hypothetical protein